ncbi:CFI-box-CTERM domain-containing protein [Bacteriovorax sp. Seq25_V]|uniref:CFI-box-CTERM domain-containing protein n=1 Tax=Bacteriovorax sp. Seq25_V TaxID=1201288 RepID=UPI00038A4E40|nr:CFI-box-CTERM domain-containing protein [Bacteriovorax sp. Seq25_V]EQC43295.1 hypothetical protein M900_2800 [Bacteriovorax sp. Seq25_V]
MAAKDKKDKSQEEEKHSDGMINAYRDRLKVLKHAQEFSSKGEIPKAVEKYSQYLGILAAYNRTTEPQLSPKMFDPVKDLTEMLLISHAYWDLARSYDRSPKLQKECIRCLQQFISFTLGFKFQHVNAQMLKKFIKSKKVYNKKAFEQALARINVESKACFIATHAYPSNDNFILDDLRKFKSILLESRVGALFVDTYYSVSPRLVDFLDNRKNLNTIITNFLIKPFLKLTHRVLKIFIL